jgi:predicted nucleic acid-binding protein
LRERVWQLRHDLTAYDATYLALALGLDDPLLLTGDSGLATRAGVALGPDRVRLTR